MIVLRTMQGLGDAIYTYPIVKCLSKSQIVLVKTNYPVIFDSLNVFTGEINSKLKVDLFPKYKHSSTSQYQQMLDSVKLKIPFEFSWNLGFTDDFKKEKLPVLMDSLNKSKKKLCVIKEPCLAHMHKINNDSSMVPNMEAMQEWVNENLEIFFFVSVGQEEIFKARLKNIDIDLNDRTTVQDLLTLCSMAEFIVTQAGHLVPIAQGLKKNFKVFYPQRITDRKLQDFCPEVLSV